MRSPRRARWNDPMLHSLINHLEFRLFLRMMQERYVQALAAEDTDNMLAASGSLGLAYSSMGNDAYARKWADEFWRCWARQQQRGRRGG